MREDFGQGADVRERGRGRGRDKRPHAFRVTAAAQQIDSCETIMSRGVPGVSFLQSVKQIGSAVP